MQQEEQGIPGPGVELHRPDGTALYVNARTIAYVRAPLKSEVGNATVVFVERCHAIDDGNRRRNNQASFQRRRAARMAIPKWLELARAELGTKEMPGPLSNPTVVSYYLDAVGSRQADAVPWCAAFVGACSREREKELGEPHGKKLSPLWQAVAAATWRPCSISARSAGLPVRTCDLCGNG